ncbi:nuclear transport factor 2 family protein [Tenacibaculum sp. S7007]|uniref:Nuclear transport factor 2 family protein n=1 Tax=Tenacibaculum pelagium TaxID=2759527 RepID=A0A839ARL3_9FLAO|nr:nuclear transport factor 2 family protein [Tenacibaculum pelagium]MBA6156978.1 nuclear transport factor 2 family protein [Tenacibaculum pelagium]
MRKTYPLVFGLLFTLTSCVVEVKKSKERSVEEEKQGILAIMTAQEKAWSNHDLEGFMKGYWKSDSLKFYGSNGITFGWDKTLANYKKGYPTPKHSGKLNFKVNDISKINNGAYFVMGEYHLKREIGDAKGVFMVIFKKIDGDWKIIADTSC